MVQSEVEVIKLNALFQKVLYKWLEGSQYPWFKVELDTSSMYLLGYTQELTFVCIETINYLDAVYLLENLSLVLMTLGLWV